MGFGEIFQSFSSKAEKSQTNNFTIKIKDPLGDSFKDSDDELSEHE